MNLRDLARRHLPSPVKRFLSRYIPIPAQRARRRSNQWLRRHAAGIAGHVLSVGSGKDLDGEGHYYREYFVNAASYTTSDITPESGADLVVDVRDMQSIAGESIDCVFCSGVLEHVDDDLTALREIHRVLRPYGILLLGLPFNQPIHLAPNDYRRYTEFGIRHLLDSAYEVLALDPIGTATSPIAYWVKARKLAQR